MVFEKKRILEACGQVSEIETIDDNCKICDRPKTVVYCRSCKRRITGVRVTKCCVIHPQVFNPMDLKVCPDCKCSHLLEVGLDDDEIAAIRSATVAASRKAEPTFPSLKSVVAQITSTFDPPVLRCVSNSESPLVGSVPSSPPEQAKSPSTVKSYLNADAPVFSYPVEKVTAKSPVLNGNIPTMSPPPNPALTTPKGLKQRLTRVSLPPAAIAELGKRNGSPGPVGVGLSICQVDGPTSKTTNSSASKFAPTTLSMPTPSPLASFNFIPHSLAPPIAETAENANLSTACTPPPSNCACARKVRFILCSNCGHYDGSGTVRKYIYCSTHPRNEGIKYCPECGGSANDIDERLEEKT